MSTRMVEVRAKVMKQNDLLARALRERFAEAGVCVVSLVSSPGSGKTAFLEKLLAGLAPELRVAALVGDLATENDAERLRRATPAREADHDGNGVPSGRADGRAGAGRLDRSRRSTFSLSRMSAIWSARRATIWARSCASCCSRRPRARTSR